MHASRTLRISTSGGAAARARGMVLVSSLLLLLVVTMLAIALFHSFGLDERIAGNTREKQRALQAAVSAEDYAEWWLSNGQTVSSLSCGFPVSTAEVCTNTLPAVVNGGNVAVIPWVTSAGAPIGGYTYVLPNATVSTSPSAGTYWQNPLFYISYLGLGTGANGNQGSVYQIDSIGYGGSPNTAAVVESTYIVQTSTQNLDGG
jgi:type IV pilus assembly protein PilX